MSSTNETQSSDELFTGSDRPLETIVRDGVEYLRGTSEQLADATRQTTGVALTPAEFDQMLGLS